MPIHISAQGLEATCYRMAMASLGVDVAAWILSPRRIVPLALVLGSCRTDDLTLAEDSATSIGGSYGSSYDLPPNPCYYDYDEYGCGYCQVCTEHGCRPDFDDVYCYPPHQCYDDADCGNLQVCESFEGGSECQTVMGLLECELPMPAPGEIPLPAGLATGVVQLRFTNVDDSGGEDLALAYPGGVQLVLGPGIDPPVDLVAPMDLDPVAIVDGDFDATGFADLIVATPTGFHVWLGDGAGQYAPTGSFLETKIIDAAAGDFDGDGDDDMVVVGGGTITLWTAIGPGDFTPATLDPPGQHRDVVAGALGSDPYEDVLVGMFDRVVVHLGSDTGFGFYFYRELPYTYVTVALVDMDGDSDRDIVTPRRRNDWTALYPHVNDGAAAFATGPPIRVPHQYPLAVTADVNGDGSGDIVLAGDSPLVQIVLGDAAKKFGCWLEIDAMLSVTAVATGDFDGDSKAEIAVAGPEGVRVLDPYP